MAIASPTVKYETRNGVAWVTMNRPEVLNAINTEMQNALGEAMQEAGKDDSVLVVVLTGEGGRSFSPGADLRQSGGEAPKFSAPDEIERCRKPVIAAVDGYCLGFGLILALRCDIRMASENSTFSVPEARVGIAGSGLHDLSKFIPLGEALWMQLTGSRMPAKRAHEIGLVQGLSADRDSLFADVDQVANDIKLGSPLALQAIKRFATVGHNLPVEYSQKFAQAISEPIGKTEDRLEGARAFAEKRPPVWKMR